MKMGHGSDTRRAYDRAMSPHAIKQPGVPALALALTALGVLGIATGDFALVWQPVPPWVPWREALAYAFGAVSLAAGLGLLWPRTAARAAALALAYCFLWWLLLRVPAFIASPLTNTGGLGENSVVLAGALALFAALHPSPGRLDLLRGSAGLRLARVLLAVGLIGCGEAHFYFLQQTAAFVPAWIPGHLAWAVATGSGFLAAAAAILAGVWPRLAATMASGMMAAFTVLIWVPDVVSAPRDRFNWTALTVSWTLTAGAWIVAQSYRGTEWFALRWAAAGSSAHAPNRDPTAAPPAGQS
jgi:uncharacterized membrane protein